MKITAVKTYLCNCFRTNWVFVKIETDSGIHGWGEATLEYKEISQALRSEGVCKIARLPG